MCKLVLGIGGRGLPGASPSLFTTVVELGTEQTRKPFQWVLCKGPGLWEVGVGAGRAVNLPSPGDSSVALGAEKQVCTWMGAWP